MSALSTTASRMSTHQGHPWLSLVAVSLGVMMVAVDGTVVGVANPTIARDLGASLAGLQWVTNGYLLAIAVLLILGGKLGDRFGRKRIFITGVLGFAVASAGCALADSVGALVAFRVLQGIAGALLMPATLAILRASFPHDQLDKAVGIWGGSSALAAASGPIVGGLLVEHVSWQSIFLLNLPLGLLAAVVAFFVVRESRDEVSGRGMDPPGVALLTAALFSITWGLIKAQDHGWGSAYVLGFLALGVAVLAAFAWRESTTREPLLPLDLFRNRSVSAGVVLLIMGLFGLFGVLFFVGLYLQNVHGYSPVETGVRMLPLTAIFAISAPLGGVLTARFGPRVPLCAGMLMIGAAMLGLTGLDVHTSYANQWPWYLAIGFGMGLVIVASTQAIVGNAPIERGGIAGGLQTTANQLGGVIGTAVLGSVIAQKVSGELPGALAAHGVPAAVAGPISGAHEIVAQGVAPIGPSTPAALVGPITDAAHQAFLSGLHTALVVAAVITFVGAALSLLVRRGHPVDPAAGGGL